MKKTESKHNNNSKYRKILIATGLGGVGRKYPDYYAKFGEENVDVVRWDNSCTDIDSHLVKLKKAIPKDEPFVFCGHSLGGCLVLELLSREKVPSLKGLALIGSSRQIRREKGGAFMMWFPWFFLWIFAFLLVLAFPITIFIWRKKTFDTYQELFKFLGRDGAKKIHKQYNLTIKKLGSVESVVNPNIPVVYVGLPQDVLIDNEDLEFTLAMFTNSRKQLIHLNTLHLIEKFDPITVEKIALEAEFLGLLKQKNE